MITGIQKPIASRARSALIKVPAPHSKLRIRAFNASEDLQSNLVVVSIIDKHASLLVQEIYGSEEK